MPNFQTLQLMLTWNLAQIIFMVKWAFVSIITSGYGNIQIEQ